MFETDRLKLKLWAASYVRLCWQVHYPFDTKSAQSSSTTRPKLLVYWHLKGQSGSLFHQWTGWLTRLTRSCLRELLEGTEIPGRGVGERESVPNTTLSSPEWLVQRDGQWWEPFNVSLIVTDKVSKEYIYPQTTTFVATEERGIEPRSFRLPA